VELIVAEQKGKGDYLQHQEEEEVKMPSDEEKNVTHRCVVYFGVLVLILWPDPAVRYLMTKG
jgi:hypothetical protein